MFWNKIFCYLSLVDEIIFKRFRVSLPLSLFFLHENQLSNGAWNLWGGFFFSPRRYSRLMPPVNQS